LANRIHPTAVLSEGVELGDDNVIGPFAVIVGPTRIGDGNGVSPHITIRTPGEDRTRPHPAAWSEAPTGDHDIDQHGVRIGDRNKLREYVSVHHGTWRATTIDSGSYYLPNSHDAHDCVSEDGATMASNVVLGGHVHAWAGPNLGIGAVLHQRVRIGPGAMVDMAFTPRREVRAFTISSGNPARHGRQRDRPVQARRQTTPRSRRWGRGSRARESSQPVGSSTGCPAISLRW
jgi:UDP-N-acetylglucosamine acyltransferase